MMRWRGNGPGRAGFAAAISIFMGLTAAGLAGPAAAQGTDPQGSSLSGFRTDPDQPIEVEADSLEVQDANHTATFIGNVRVKQGDVRMKSDRLIIHYAGQRRAGSRIDKIAASGNVLVSAPDGQTASGAWANYLVPAREIEMGDSVVLTQGANVIRGARLHVDLNGGTARVAGGGTENGGTGRVKGLFHPSSE
tara:strand:- start:4128 stop:4706 length:579 start_codon:yes stop_codon:yes gene_type:complete